jgi:hypothetical protein
MRMWQRDYPDGSFGSVVEAEDGWVGNRFEEAFLFQKSIDKRTYDDHLARLREDLTLAEMRRNEAHTEQLDVEGVLAFAEHVLSHAASLWTNANLADRGALQQALFPNGLAWSETGFGTAVTCSAFSYLQTVPTFEEGVASPPGFEPGF